MASATFGKYRLIAELGHGGMADVFLAVQAGPIGSGFRKLTVIKRLRQNLADEPEFVAMLVDEARIAARLNHPNVVQTNEVGNVGQHYFIAMEYLDGQPMHRLQHRAMQRVKAGAAPLVTKEQQYIIVMDALAGLHHAHELMDFDGTPLDIVHRDMTPHNIFVTYAGQVKVVDFGIAKAVGRASETRQGVVKGKVRYMAPEQAVGRALDRRADVFSMGVILWEIASGRRMWKDKDDLQIVHELVAGNVPISPRSVEPSVPEALDQICQKALAMRPDDRYASAEEFRLDLEQYLAESGHLVEARRKLAPSLSELFKDKRGEIRSVIEKQLAAIDEKASGELEAVHLPTDSLSGPTPVSMQVGHSGVDANVRSHTATAIYDPSRRESSRSRIIKPAVAAACVAFAVLAGVMIARRPSTGSMTAAVPPPVVEPATTTVTLKVDATPTHARVRLDDGAPRGVPLEMQVPKDEAVHRLEIEADGFITRTESVRFGSDLAMSFALQPVEKPPVTVEKPKPPAAPVTVVTVVKRVVAPPPEKTPDPAPPAAAPAPATTTTPSPEQPKQNRPSRKDLDLGDPWATK